MKQPASSRAGGVEREARGERLKAARQDPGPGAPEGNAAARASITSAAPVNTEVVSQQRSDLIPKLGCEPPDPLRMPGLDSGDLGRANHRGNR
jgi:hypothetical protein